MKTLREYVVTLKNMKDSDDFYNDMESHSAVSCVPCRKVKCVDRRPISRNTNYLLTDQEAQVLTTDPRVLAVELTLEEQGVEVGFDFVQTETWTKNGIANSSHKNWGLFRVANRKNVPGWGDDQNQNHTGTIYIHPEGEHVDVVIVDGGHPDENHPEFAVNSDGTGGTRHKPYNWLALTPQVNGGQAGTYLYTAKSNHAAHVASIVLGNTNGWARKANFYSLQVNDQGITTQNLWDYLRVFHSQKSVNPVTGHRNPTITNHSWSIRANVSMQALVDNATQVMYRGQLHNGPFTQAQLTNNFGIVPMFGQSIVRFDFRNTAIEADIQLAIEEGIIFVGSAGNSSQMSDVPSGADYDNYVVYSGITRYYNRGCTPGHTPGFTCVGASGTKVNDRKLEMSTCGPRVDIYAPGQHIQGSVADIALLDPNGPVPVVDPRNSNFYQIKFSGTSMSSPQVCGVLACVLKSYPSMNQSQALEFLINSASESNQMFDGDGTFGTGVNLLGSPNRFLSFGRARFYTKTKTLTASTPFLSQNGTDYMPMQFYLNTDIQYSPQKLGNHSQDTKQLAMATYFNRWTGKHVDIVTLEAGTSSSSGLEGIHTTHPDFRDIDNPSVVRVHPQDWPGLVSPLNNQVASNLVFTSHAMSVLSVAGGAICGFAKKANLYAAYIAGESQVVNVINSIINWHQAKQPNPSTGVTNPTIMIGEFQYLGERRYGIKIDDIVSITDLGVTINRPGATWGTDFTPFVSRNIIPFRILDPSTSTWEWCIVFPYQDDFASFKSSVKAALNNAWDNGITFITAAGNNGGVYVKEDDPRSEGTFCTISGTVTRYNISTNITVTTTSISTWYPFRAFIPHGLVNAIDVAAGQNSETWPILDAYSNRGPGIDIAGLGDTMWSAGPGTTYADGNLWRMFGGTSCAAPTVVGIAACIMERYFFYNNVWPTPNQVKAILLAEANSVITGVNSTTWSNRPLASTNYSRSELSGTTSNLNRIQNGVSGNGNYRLTDLAGTTSKRVFFNAQGFDRKNTIGKRPISGTVYPRPKIKR